MKLDLREPLTALIVVDVQRDFCPGGALAVPDGDAVVPLLARAAEVFRAAGLPVVYTRDWHPPDHCSFAAQGGPWPPHCVAGSAGAGFHPRLRVADDAWVVSKATRTDRDAYSGFDGTGLAEELRRRDVRRVVVGGLATDYCVKSTSVDAVESGFETLLLEDAVRAVEVEPGDGERALGAMRDAGVRTMRVADLEG